MKFFICTRRGVLEALHAMSAVALAAPLSALGQSTGTSTSPPAGKIWRIGYLTLANRPTSASNQSVLSQSLRELGYAEGGNLLIEARYADGDVARLPSLAAELVQLKVDLIIAMANQASSAAKAATSTIPIVMPVTNDPVGTGLIASLARPGGNITGLADMSVELGPKRLEMLLAMTATKPPKVSRVAMLGPSDNPVMRRFVSAMQDGASRVGVAIVPVYAASPEAIVQAFATLREQAITALIVVPHPLLGQQRNQIAQLATQQRVAVAAAYGEFAEAGCLLTYGLDLPDNLRRAAAYVDKIFKGAKPADLPVEQPVKFELVINGKTAKGLGLKIPQALLVSADRVIE